MRVNFAMDRNPFGDNEEFTSVEIGHILRDTLINIFKHNKSHFLFFQKILVILISDYSLSLLYLTADL